MRPPQHDLTAPILKDLHRAPFLGGKSDPAGNVFKGDMLLTILARCSCMRASSTDWGASAGGCGSAAGPDDCVSGAGLDDCVPRAAPDGCEPGAAL